MENKNKNPNVGAKGRSKNNPRINFTKKQPYRQFNRALLPSPASYYSKQFPNFKIKNEWVKVHCCFHSPDINPSLYINMVNGNFKCHACDAKGCDVLKFHRMRYGMNFIEAVNYFGAWGHE